MSNSKRIRQLVACLLTFALLLIQANTVLADDINTVKNILNMYYYRSLTTQERSALSLDELLNYLDDPYTYVMNAEEEESFLNSIEGDLTLIGVSIKEAAPITNAAAIRHRYVIDFVLEDSSAEAADIRQGDYLTAVDGKATGNMTLEDVYLQLDMPVNSKLILTLQRNGQAINKEVSPQFYHLPIINSHMLDGNILYIHLLSMGYKVDKELDALLKKHPQTTGIILDLTGNPGGYIYSTCSLADLLLPPGYFIGTKDKYYTNWSYLTHPATYQQPIVCLVDSDSASAGEILPAVLQDYKRSLIVGQPTFGKFSAQTIIPVNDELKLKYTFAQIVTPQGRMLNHQGLSPDITMDLVAGTKFAYQLLLQTTNTTKKHALVIDPSSNQAYLDARMIYPSDVIIQDTATFIRLRDAAVALQLPLEWDSQADHAWLWNNNTRYAVNSELPYIWQQEGHYYITLEQLADLVRGELVFDEDHIILYYN